MALQQRAERGRVTRVFRIGFERFLGKQFCQSSSASSLATDLRGTIIDTSWDKLLLHHDDGTYKIYGYAMGDHGIAVKCKSIEDAVFPRDGLHIIENGKIKSVNLQTGDMVELNSSHTWMKLSLIEIEETKIYALTEKGQLYALLEGIPAWIPLVIPVAQLSCGISHGIALAENGTVYTWGNGSRGQVGHGSVEDQKKPKLVDLLCGVKITAISAGGWHSLALADTGDVYVWGWNENGQLGFPTKSSRLVVDIRKDNSANNESQIGMLTSPKLLELEKHVKSENFLSIVSMSCGSRHSVVITKDGTAISWGWGKYGQLGQNCCTLVKASNIQEKSKRIKLCSDDSNLHGCDCSAEEHVPGVVDFSSQGDIRAFGVQCGRWSTYISYTRDPV